MRSFVAALLVLSLVACKREKAQVPVQTPPTPGARGAQQQPAPPTTTGIDVGKVMPAYAAAYLDGKPFELAGERGNVALVNLWATWCGPCRVEIPELQKLHDTHKARGFKVIGVSLDEGGPEIVQSFVDENKVTYPIVVDPDNKIAAILNTQVLPTTVLLDRNGTIVWKRYGQIEAGDEELAKAIEKAL